MIDNQRKIMIITTFWVHERNKQKIRKGKISKSFEIFNFWLKDWRYVFIFSFHCGKRKIDE